MYKNRIRGLTSRTVSLILVIIFLMSASGCSILGDIIFGEDTTSSVGVTDTPSEEPTDSTTEGSKETPPVKDSSDSTDNISTPTESVSDNITESTTAEPHTTKQTESPIDSEDETEPQNPSEPIVSLEKSLYTYYDMVSDLKKLAAAYGNRFKYYSIAKTFDGRDVYVALIGSGKASKQIVVDSGTHGREWLAPQAVMAVMEYYLSNYETGEYGGVKLSKLFADIDLYFIPMFNPDGITISQLGVDGLLKQESRDKVREIYDTQKALGNTSMSFAQYQYYWKANARGVDINRNFPVDGNYMNQNQQSFPSSSGYSPEPSSESETRGYMELVNKLSNPICAVSIHSQGRLIYWDCGQKNAREESLKLAELVKSVTGYNLYNYSSFTAASSDWAVIAKSIPSVTIETGYGNCPLPHSELIGIYNAIRDIFAAVAKNALGGFSSREILPRA